MPYIKLTQKFVDGQGQARAGRRKDNLMGRGQRACGGLRPTAHSGAKSFVFQYRTRKGSISRRMKLDGKYLPLETEREAKNGNGDKHERETGSPLDNAKAEAIAARNAVTAGRDQLTECCRKTTSATNTLQTIAEDYMKREGKKLKSRYERERILKKYIYPKLGPRQIDEIRRHDVVTHRDKDRGRERGRHGRPCPSHPAQGAQLACRPVRRV